jgi:hypothetical protein
MSGRPAALAVALLACLLLVGAVPAPAAADARPTSPFCSAPLSTALVDAGGGRDVTVESTTARVALRADGDAVWTTTATFENASTAARLRSDAASRALVLDVAGGDVGPVTVSGVGPRTVAFAYRTGDVAARVPGGLFRVDYFRLGDGTARSLSCDRLTVVAPPGYALANDPSPDVVAVRSDGARANVTAVDGPFSLVFAPAFLPGPVRTLVGHLAVVVGVADVVATNLLLLAALPGVCLGGALFVCHRVFGVAFGADSRRARRARESALAVLTLVFVAVVPAGLLFRLVSDSPLLPLVAGFLTVAVVAGVGSRGTAPPTLSGALLPPATGGLVAGGVAAAVVALDVVPAGLAAASGFLTVAAAFGYPVGVAAAHRHPARRLVAVAVLAFAVAVVAWFPMTRRAAPVAVAAAFALTAACFTALSAGLFALVGVAAGRE